jgi:hypothetical protein
MRQVRFSSNYKRYKNGTRKIVGWLYETVKACENLPIPVVITGAKDTTKASSAYQTLGSYIASTLPVDLYPSIAKAISESHAEIQVPGKLIRLLKGVIIGRQCVQQSASCELQPL